LDGGKSIFKEENPFNEYAQIDSTEAIHVEQLSPAWNMMV